MLFCIVLKIDQLQYLVLIFFLVELAILDQVSYSLVKTIQFLPIE
jgi:hypothetical protein